jgi:hypothetical protein
MEIGDIVRVDLSTAYDKKHWKPLSKIRGVIMGFAEDGSAQVRWIKPECGLTLHWQTSGLVLVHAWTDTARALCGFIK